jgi:DNA helicase-4
VGDDWQSIYRFTGSDISLFYSFVDYFGFTKKCEITNTYRFSSELASLTEKFITRNPHQIKKSIKANKLLNSKPFKILYYDYNDLEIFEKIITSIREKHKECTLLILGRYNSTLEKYNSSISTIKTKYRNSINIDSMTIHKAKGMEADYVILLDVTEGKNGFPSQVIDDDVLNLVLLSDESYPYAEERRLFYVAMTRTKNKFFIINKREEISPFIHEIVALYGKSEDDECPICNGKLRRIVTGPYEPFLGCQNYPKCIYSKSEKRTRTSYYS